MAFILLATVVNSPVRSLLRWASLVDDVTVVSLFQRIILNVTVCCVVL